MYKGLFILLFYLLVINFQAAGQTFSKEKKIEWIGWDTIDKSTFVVKANNAEMTIDYNGIVRYKNFKFDLIPYPEGKNPYHVPMQYIGMVYRNYIVGFEKFAILHEGEEFILNHIVVANYSNNKEINVEIWEYLESTMYFVGAIGIDKFLILLYEAHAIGIDTDKGQIEWINLWSDYGIPPLFFKDYKVILEEGKSYILIDGRNNKLKDKINYPRYKVDYATGHTELIKGTSKNRHCDVKSKILP